MPHTLDNNPDGSTAITNVRTGRDTWKVFGDDTFYHASVAATPRVFDDFMGATISITWTSQKGSDGATAHWANTVNLNGTAVATMGAGAGATYAVNGVQLDGGTAGLQWKASAGGLVFEARYKISAITNVATFIGFTDQVSALEMPWTLATTTFTSNATDGCGFLFDTSATTVTIRCVGVKADTDATAIDTGLAFVADTYRVFRIEVDTSGGAVFFIDGTQVGVMANALTTSVFLTPVVAGFARAAASRTATLDYILTQASRV